MTTDVQLDLLFVDDAAVIDVFVERRRDLVDPFLVDGQATMIWGGRAESGEVRVSPGMWLPGYVLLSEVGLMVMKANVVTDATRDRAPSLRFRVGDAEATTELRARLARSGGAVSLVLMDSDRTLFEVFFLPPTAATEEATDDEAASSDTAMSQVEQRLEEWAAAVGITVDHAGTVPTAAETVSGRARDALAATSDKVTLSEFREATTETMGKIVEVLAVHEAEISRLQQENRELKDRLAQVAPQGPVDE